MGFMLPTYRTVDTLIDEGDWNTYVKANFEAGIPNIFTTKGDLAVGSGEQAASRLGIGSNEQTLVVNPDASLGVAWSYFHRARARRANQVVLPNGTTTILTWDTEDYDSSGMVAPGSPNVVIPTTGIYRMAIHANFNRNGQAFNIDNNIGLVAYRNGAVIAYPDWYQPAAQTMSNFTVWPLDGVIAIEATAGTTFAFGVYQNLGGTCLIDAGYAWVDVEAV